MSFIKKAVKAFDQQVFIVAALVALVGCALAIGGCIQEQSSQTNLLHSGGRAALDAYTSLVASHQLSLSAFFVESVTGHCFAYGAVLEGAGSWVVFVASPLIAILTAFLRSSASWQREGLPARFASN